MSSGGLKLDCRTFAPNIFNKNKCTNCFRQKEEHSAQALECNRTSRQTTKCGYMFVAPGWDFSDPIKRTKRWQRRWFVLYDDGELNYSVDEHPETVPQAVIDMNQVLEVSSAEDVTGHPYSLALTAPDRVHFVKASCREEARWWTDVLTVFTRSKGRHKRNATFPGGQSTTIIQQQTTGRSETPNPIRPRYNSCDTEPVIPRRNITISNKSQQWNRQSMPETAVTPQNVDSSPTLETKVYKDNPVSSASPPTRDKISPDEKARFRHQHRDKKRSCSSSPVVKDNESIINYNNVDNFTNNWLITNTNSYKYKEEGMKCRELSSVLNLPSSHSTNIILGNVSEKPQRENTDIVNNKQDLDRCKQVLSHQSNHYSSLKDLAHTLPAEKLLNINKGWLNKFSMDHHWSRHWFVLKGAKLTYYRDPSAEEVGTTDGIINLNCVTNIIEVPVIRNFGFQLTLLNDDKLILSAVTTVIRSNWITLLRRAANLSEKSAEIINLPASLEKDSIIPTVSLTPRSMQFSSDDEYRTASEGRSQYENGDWGEQLPPSPPLTRTPISRVKERARSRSSSGSRVCKRSRSSPSSSRRSTIDSIRTDDSMPSYLEDEISDPEQVVINTSRKHHNYFECAENDIFSENNITNNMENKVENVQQHTGLYKIDLEAIAQERQAKELLALLEKTEKKLNERSDNIDTSKGLYHLDKKNHKKIVTEPNESSNVTAEKYKNFDSPCETSIEQLKVEPFDSNDHLVCDVDVDGRFFKRTRDSDYKSYNHTKIKKSRSVDSLSELMNFGLDLNLHELNKDQIIQEYTNLQSRFERAVQEIKMMKLKLRESYSLHDELELINIALRQSIKLQNDNRHSDLDLMAARVDNLTVKLSDTEKRLRISKQKFQESRGKRRSLSLKGRESFSISKEIEDKMQELEMKILALQSGKPITTAVKITKQEGESSLPNVDSLTPKEEKKLKQTQARLRRKSLDSVTSSEPMKVLIRLSSLESKVNNVLDSNKPTSSLEELETSKNHVNKSDFNVSSPEKSLSVDKLYFLETNTSLVKEKVNQCLDLINEYRTQSSGKCNKKLTSVDLQLIETILKELNITLSSNLLTEYNTSIFIESIPDVLKHTENTLKKYLNEIINKQSLFTESDDSEKRNNLELLIGKLAYEMIIVGCAHNGLNSFNKTLSTTFESYIYETGCLIFDLKRKLSNHNSSQSYNTKSLVNCSTKKFDSTIKPKSINSRSDLKLSIFDASVLYLSQLRDELNTASNDYETQKLNQLAYCLAIAYKENQNVSNPDTFNNTLMQVDITRIIDFCIRSYEPSIIVKFDHSFNTDTSEMSKLQQWSKEIRRSIHSKMNEYVKQLITTYENTLQTLKYENVDNAFWSNKKNKCIAAKDLLKEFFDFATHKALINSRITILNQWNNPLEPFKMIEYENMSENSDVFLSPNSIQEYNNPLIKKGDPISSKDKAYIKDVVDTLALIERELNKIEEYIGENIAIEEKIFPEKDIDYSKTTDWNSICGKCSYLHRRIVELTSCVLKRRNCNHCNQLQSTIIRLNSEHEDKMQQLQKDNSNESLHDTSKNKYNSQTELQDHCADKQFCTRNLLHCQQIENVQTPYDQSINMSVLHRALQEEDNIRQKYQAEIEQLRALCEKGLVAMESSHRRIIFELEERHKREREQLRLEKEAALAEETQATLAALDAMRKAHEAEVQREIAKFKKEFVRRMQLSSQSSSSLVLCGEPGHNKEHEEEMEEIKQEILSLSEKYSVKCVESATLEEELIHLNSKLSHAQQRIMQLDSRNKQLQAHLISDFADSNNSMSQWLLNQDNIDQKQTSNMN